MHKVRSEILEWPSSARSAPAFLFFWSYVSVQFGRVIACLIVCRRLFIRFFIS